MKNANGVTYTGIVKGQLHADELAAEFFTGMGREELFNLKCDMGARWIKVWFRHFGLREDDAEDWWTIREIVQVWNLHWRKTDHLWVVPILHKVVESERRDVYQDMHLVVFRQDTDEYLNLAMAMYRAMERINRNLRNDQKGRVPVIKENYGKEGKMQ